MSTVPALKYNNPLLGQFLKDGGLTTHEVQGDGDISVKVDTIYFINHGPKSNYRPALHIKGILVGLTPYDSKEIACRVNQVTFSDQIDGAAPTVDAFYEFNDEQLVSLVAKGFFYEGFETPKELVNEVWPLPAQYKALVIEPESDKDAPLVFIDVLNRDGLLIDANMSGLDLTEYFPNYLAQLEAENQTKHELENTINAPLERTSEIDDVFKGDEMVEKARLGQLETQEQTTNMQQEQDETKPNLPIVQSPLFDSLMKDMKTKYGENFEIKPANETGETLEAQEEMLVGNSRENTFTSVMGSKLDEIIAGHTPKLEEVEDVQLVDGGPVTAQSSKIEETVKNTETKEQVATQIALEDENDQFIDDEDSYLSGDDEDEYEDDGLDF